MTNSTRLLGMIMTAALFVAGARGQEIPLPDFETSPDLTLPSIESEELPSADLPEAGDESVLSPPQPIDLESLDGFQGDAVEHYGPDPHGAWLQESAPIESTGTWLRRGFWYAEAEAVVWNRHWNRDNKIFAADDVQVTNPNFFEPRASLGILNTNRLLLLDGAQPGEDASVRFTLGHFLFRDSKNRDHTSEFTVLGGGDWHQHRQISSVGNFGLFVPFYIAANNRTFDQSTFQQIDYSSHYSSFEWNYRVKQRLRRDQMIMDSNGHWHRATNSGWNRDYLVGLRFMELRDIFDWRAEDIAALGRDGSYLIRTDNDMFGFQMGAGTTYETSRWSLGLHTKGGVFLNDQLGRTTLDFTLDDLNDADLRLANDGLSFIGEAKLLSRWHLTPDFSLRASYEMMYITSQALAPNQATFITNFAYLNTSQDPFYHGASFGFEGYW
jgi:hypothetical protein